MPFFPESVLWSHPILPNASRSQWRPKLDERVGSAIGNFDSWIAGLGFCTSASEKFTRSSAHRLCAEGGCWALAALLRHAPYGQSCECVVWSEIRFESQFQDRYAIQIDLIVFHFAG
jgi:hypothetical protein